MTTFTSLIVESSGHPILSKW